MTVREPLLRNYCRRTIEQSEAGDCNNRMVSPQNYGGSLQR